MPGHQGVCVFSVLRDLELVHRVVGVDRKLRRDKPMKLASETIEMVPHLLLLSDSCLTLCPPCC